MGGECRDISKEPLAIFLGLRLPFWSSAGRWRCICGTGYRPGLGSSYWNQEASEESEKSATDTAQERFAAGRALVEACHDLGFVIVKGHGLSNQEIGDAFPWTKRLFDLTVEEKMKAPHPPGNMPHRGYSGIGKEKVYTPDDLGRHMGEANVGQQLRKISDFKVFPTSSHVSSPRVVGI